MRSDYRSGPLGKAGTRGLPTTFLEGMFYVCSLNVLQCSLDIHKSEYVKSLK
jgi:hypothetical protein